MAKGMKERERDREVRVTRRLTTDTEAKPTLFTPHSGH